MNFKEFYLLMEKKTTEYGCLMAMIPKDKCKQFTAFTKKYIDKANLWENRIEDDSHTTVIYGFHGDLSKELKSLLHRWGLIDITLGKISRFSNDERDVIKIEVKSDDIKKLHAFLMEHYKDKITTDFPKWNGHITLAYVKKGAHKELDGSRKFDGKKFTFNSLIYSTPGMHKKVKIPLIKNVT